MNTFVFSSKKIVKNTVRRIFEQYQKHNNIMDFVKVATIFAAGVFFFFLYLYYVNMASTRGYFLRQAMQENNSITFEHEIVKTQLLKVQQTNRELMKTVTNNKTTEKRAITITIPQNN